MDPEDDTARQAATSLKQDLRRRLAATLRANRQASAAASLVSVQALMDSLAAGGAVSFSSSSTASDSAVVDISHIRSTLVMYSDALARMEETVGPHSALGSEGVCGYRCIYRYLAACLCSLSSWGIACPVIAVYLSVCPYFSGVFLSHCFFLDPQEKPWRARNCLVIS